MLLLGALLSFALICLLFSAFGQEVANWIKSRWAPSLSEAAFLGIAFFSPAALGYLAFIGYFIHPLVGRITSYSLIALCVAAFIRLWTRRHRLNGAVFKVSILVLLAGAMYISALLMYPGPKFSDTASERFLGGMPPDNRIPREVAERLYTGESLKIRFGDWLSSDRPPLQAGLALVLAPPLVAAGIPFDAHCGAAGVWFQLLWIPAVWMLLQWLKVPVLRCYAGVAALAFTGTLFFNSIYVWPKLGAAALVLTGFCLLCRNEKSERQSTNAEAGLAGALFALGMLGHGGVIFALFAAAPLILLLRRGALRTYIISLLVFIVVSLPWICYQRFYDPPGNRLAKWHIAGVMEASDTRPLKQTLQEEYAAIGWSGALHARRTNLHNLFDGNWTKAFYLNTGKDAFDRRTNEFFYTFRSFSGWIIAAPAGLWLFLAAFTRRGADRQAALRHAIGVGWLVLTLAIWVLLMFQPVSTVVHQGAMTVQLLGLGLLASWLLLLSMRLFIVIAVLQAIACLLTWLPPSAGLGFSLSSAAVAVFIASFIGVAGWTYAVTSRRHGPAQAID